MTSKLFAFAALVLLLTACSGERQIGQDTECVEDGDCPAGFVCENGLCEGASSASTDGGDPGSVGDGGVTVRATGDAAGAPPGVQVEVETEDCARSPMCQVKPGRSVTFYAPDIDGYRFDGWGGDARCFDPEKKQVLKLDNVSADIQCIAKYVKRVTVTGGSDGLSADVAASSAAEYAECGGASCQVDEGNTVLLTASEVSGYRFTGFAGDGCGDAEGLSVYVQAGQSDIVCTAGYVRSFEVGALAIGATTPIDVQSDTAFSECISGRCVVDEQGEVTLNAPALAGYRFAGWSGDAACVGSSPTLTIMPITANVSCAANYVARFTATGIATGSPSNPVPVATSSSDFAQCAAGACVVDAGSDVVISAQTVAGYRFTGFSGAGCEDVSGTAVTLSDLSADVVCRAQYVQGISIAGNVVGASGDVIASSSSPGNDCSAGGCVLDAGGSVTLTAPSIAGYRFTGWTGDTGCAGSTPTITFNNVRVSATCNANFIARRDVTFPDPSGGSIVASNIPANSSCDGDNCIVDNALSLTLTALPDGGYRFNGWTGCADTPTARLDLTNITSNLTCTASFVRQWSVAFSAGSGGSVSAPAAQCPVGSPCTVDSGAALAITALPAAGFRFVAWSGVGCQDSVPATVNVVDLSGIASSVTCSASFARQWTVSYAAGAGGSVSAPAGSCPAGSPCTVDQGSSLAISAAPGAGFRFAGWAGAGCTDSVSSTREVAELSNIGADISCNASFVRQWSVSYAAGPGGSVSAPSAQCATGSPCAVDQGANLTISASAAAGYRFNGWSGAGCNDSNPATSELVELVNISDVVTCSASFVRQWSVTYAAGTGGSVSAPVSQCAGSPCLVSQGASLAITAAAASGYRFNGWTGAGCTDNIAATVNVVDLVAISGAVTCNASFTRQWSVTYASAGGGSVNAPAARCPSGSPCTVDDGADLVITATPDAGYRFAGWTGTGCADSVPGSVNVADLANIDAPITCSASFLLQGAVTYSAGTGGSVSAPVSQCPNGSPCTVDQGANLALTATAAAGYRFGSWSGPGCVDSNAATPLVVDLSNITSGVTCAANFVRQWPVTYAASTGGSVNAPSSQCPSGTPCTVDQGASLAISAVPAAGYRFGAWTGAGCADSVAATVNIVDLSNIGAAVTCTAGFVRQWQVAYSANTGGAVSAPSVQCPTGSPCTVDQGAGLVITASPAAGYRFGSWSGTGCVDSVAATVNAVDLSNIGSAVTCSANFVRQWSVTYSAGSGGSVSAPAGACPAGSPCTVDQGASLAISAAPAAGYRFDSWSGAGCLDSVAGTVNVADLSNISASVTCTASFTLQGAVIYSAGSGGSVSAPVAQCPSGSPCTIDQGANLSITALPSAGYRFGSWTGTGCSDTNASTPLVVDLTNITTGITCTANFVRQWSVTYSASTGGSVSAPAAQCPSGSPCTLDQGASLAISAVPAAGYRFGAWTGAGCTDSDSSSPRVADLSNIGSAITCAASFVRQWTVAYSASAGGAVSAPSAQCPSGSPCTLDQGESLAISALPAAGFRFDGWSGTGCTDSIAATLDVVDLAAISSAVTCSASFVRQWSVSYAANAGGSVSAPVSQCPSGSPCTVEQGDNLAISAAPASGFRFAGWSGSGCTDSVPATVQVVDLSNISTAVTCTASFVRQWSVSYSAGTGGSVSAPAATCPSGSPCSVDQGSNLALTASPAAGFRFGAWQGSGCTDSVTGTANVADLAGISTAITCTASFVRQWPVTYSAGTGGSVSAPSAQCPSGSPCAVDQGSSLAISAAPASGYRFAGWAGTNCSDSVAGTVNVVDLSNIGAAVVCTASFVRQWAVTYAAGAGGSVNAPSTQCPSGSPCTVDQGSNLTVTATPAAGFRFGGWTGTGCVDSIAGTPEVADLVSIGSAVTCTASFLRQWSVTYSANAGGSVSAPSAQCPSGSPCSVEQGDNLAITAVPASGFRFGGWTGSNCADSVAGTVNVVDLSNIGSAVTCTASFVRQWVVSYSAGAGGSVSAPVAQCASGSPCTVDQGANLAITAVPAAGFRFNAWSGAGCTDNAPTTREVADLTNISSAVTCSASFVQRFTIGAIVSAGGGGSVSATPNAQPACSGASCTVDQDVPVTLLATPTSVSTRFINWTGTSPACTGTSASLTLQNVSATCTANFTQRWSIGAVVGAVAGGSVSATPSGQPPCSGASCTVDQGVAVTLLAALSSNAYRFVNWTGANAACTGTSPSLTLQNVNATCTANFIQRWTIGAVVAAGGGGVTATPSGQPACSGASCTVDQGVQVSLVANANAGFRLLNWSGANAACTGTNPTLTLSNTNATCTATFVQRFTIAAVVGAVPGASVSATPTGLPACAGASCTVDQNVAVTLNASISTTAYRFVGWTGTNPACTGNNPSLTLQNVNATCTAGFRQRWTVSFPDPAVGSITPSNFAPSTACDADSCDVDDATAIRLTAAPDNLNTHRFASWSGCSTSTNPVLDLASVTTNAVCTASFVRRWSVTFTGAPTGGTVSSVPVASCGAAGLNNCVLTVDQGSNVDLTATVAAGFRFDSWTCTDADLTTVNVLDLNGVSADLTCNASFAREIQRVTIAVARAPGTLGQAQVQTPTSGNPVCTGIGSINGSCVVDSGTSVTLTASVPGTQPDTRFVRWSGGAGCASNALSHALTVSGNVTCTAEFYGLWSRTYRVAGQVADLGFGTMLDPSGQVLVSGMMSPGTTRAWLGQLDENTGTVLGHGGYSPGSTVQGYGMATNNDGYVVTAGSLAAQVSRPVMLGFDKERVLRWVREIPTADGVNDYLQRAAFHPETGYAGVGYIDDQTRLGHLAIVSPDDGSVRFNRTFCMADPRSCLQRPSCFSTQPVDIVRIDRGFAVASQVEATGRDPNAFFAMLTIFDPSGRTIEEYTYRRPANGESFHNLVPQGLINTPDGGFLMVGRTQDLAAASQPLPDGFAMKLTRSGDIEWQTRIGNPGTDELFTRATVSLDDGEYALTGYATGGSQNSDGWFVRLLRDGTIFPDNPNTRPNENGNQLYHLGSTELLYDIVPTLNGGYAMTGARFGTGDPGTSFDMWTMRVDNAGVIAFNSPTLGTRTVATHVQSDLRAEGPIKAECIVNEDRFTEGSNQFEEYVKNSTPFTVNETVQAP